MQIWFYCPKCDRNIKAREWSQSHRGCGGQLISAKLTPSWKRRSLAEKPKK